MKMKNLKIVLILVASIALTSCAKQRPVETRKDPEHSWISKEPFVGSGKGKAWLYKVTVTKTSSNIGFVIVGLTSDVRLGHFEFSKDKLRLINDVTSTEPTDKYSRGLLNEWDITHHDVKLAESDGKVTNKEVEDTEDKTWEQKRQFQIKFESSNISEVSAFPEIGLDALFECFDKKSSSLVPGSLAISDDYLSWDVDVSYEKSPMCDLDIRRFKNLDFTYSVRYKYSFKKDEKSSYAPYVYKGTDDPVISKHGMFRSKLETLDPKTGAYKISYLMNRWDPNKTHHYYFTKDFPEEYKSLFTDPEKGIFARTNAIFIENNLPTRFEIHENNWDDGNVKELGDLRYSFIHFVNSKGSYVNNQHILGYGPSDNHPLTGELISGTVNVWVEGLKLVLEQMNRNISLNKEEFARSSIINAMSETLKTEGFTSDVNTWTNNFDLSKGRGEAYNKLLLDPSLTFAPPGGYLTISKTSDHEGAINNFDGTEKTEERIEKLISRAWSGGSTNNVSIVNNYVSEVINEYEIGR